MQHLNRLIERGFSIVIGDPDRLLDERRSAASDCAIRRLCGKGIGNDIELFREVAAALQFPFYFGWNWDALDECISDLSWIPGPSVELVLGDPCAMSRLTRIGFMTSIRNIESLSACGERKSVTVTLVVRNKDEVTMIESELGSVLRE